MLRSASKVKCEHGHYHHPDEGRHRATEASLLRSLAEVASLNASFCPARLKRLQVSDWFGILSATGLEEQLIKDAYYVHPTKLMVGKIQGGLPGRKCQGAHAQPVRSAIHVNSSKPCFDQAAPPRQNDEDSEQNPGGEVDPWPVGEMGCDSQKRTE